MKGAGIVAAFLFDLSRWAISKYVPSFRWSVGSLHGLENRIVSQAR